MGLFERKPERDYEGCLQEFERRLTNVEGILEDIATKLRKLDVELIQRLEDSYKETKDLKTLWKARINKLQETESYSSKKRLLGQKIDST